VKDYYDVLGIPRDAAPGVVKAAYEGRMKKAARLGDAERGAAERELKEAYAILSNPAKREDFDASLTEVDAKLAGSGSNAPLVIGVAVVILAALGAGYFQMERSKAQRATQIEKQRAAEQQKAAAPKKETLEEAEGRK
jgi:DnaJ-class molecular chaperone